MRGKGIVRLEKSVDTGITPAYAGKSFAFLSIFSTMSGSPPPMRGKAHSSSISQYTGRITPAYAGKRDGVCGTRSKLEDHPRLCGEK